MRDSELPNHRIRSGWNTEAMLMGGPLTDKKIEKYQKQGYYSAELKAARRDLQNRKKAKRDARDKANQNFIERDGRLIYSPLG